MSGLVSFHTLHALYCYLELFHHHIPPVISCDNNPISSRRSLKFHLIKFKQETGGEHSNKSHLFLSYKCCCNTCWKRSGLWTFRGQPRFSWSGLRCVSNDCPGEEEKKKKNAQRSGSNTDRQLASDGCLQLQCPHAVYLLALQLPLVAPLSSAGRH